MSFMTPQKTKAVGPGPFTIAFLLVALFLVVVDSRPYRFATSLWQDGGRNSLLSKRPTAITEEGANSGLLEAVISIVQTYYVDAARVENSNLITGAMRSLAFAIPEAQFEEDGESLTLRVKGVGVTIQRSNNMTYDDLLNRFKTLAKFCSASNLSDLVSSSAASMLGSERSGVIIVLNAMLSALDAHSSLMSPEGYKDLRQGTDGSFGGLGVLVGIKNYQLTVLKPMPRSPAQRMGLKRNDRILSIDGFPTFGLSLDQLVSHMRGEPGSTAQLAVLRPDAQSPYLLAVPREIIEVDSVDIKEIHSGNVHILHLTIDSFSARTGKEVADAVKSFKKKFPLSGVVLDMRSNPGGLLDQAIEVSDVFLKRGIIVSTRGRRDEVENATSGGDQLEFPLVVLMNEDSASASEIVAGALQDNGRAIIVGQPSFGKGSVQTLFELPADRALKLTIARYLTPSNRSIQNVGIMPDIWVQPVGKKSQNKNLFGSYRYRSEVFLPNHLSSVDVGSSTVPPSPLLKGFYLKPTDGLTDLEQESTDVELGLAQTIIRSSNSLYGSNLPESARRASHILAVALPDLRTQIADQTNAVSTWLKSSQRVDWVEGSATEAPKLKLQLTQDSLESSSGSKLSIPWKISNSDVNDARHISIFVQSPISGIETTELLVGDLRRGESREGFIELDIPVTLAPGNHRLIAGVAIDAVALGSVVSEFSVLINPSHFGDIQVASIFEDGAGSFQKGVLDPGETGALRITVKNVGEVDVRGLSLEAINLSGSQIRIGKPTSQPGSILKNETVEIVIPVTGASALENRSMSIGYVLKSNNLNGSIAKIAEVKSVGSRRIQADSRLTH